MTNGGLHIEIRGTVQGVGYRPWVFQLAQRAGIHGVVRNDSAGVSIDAFGTADALDQFVAALRGGTPPAARVQSVRSEVIPFVEHSAFAITDSVASSERRVSIPSDLATCDDCVRELLDPTDRRFRYPFINCTNCGPRYSIVRDAPYDRPKTSMASFRMCARCLAEYESPSDRRFHAQPNACPDCGPALTAMGSRHERIVTPDAIRFAARAIRAGMTVALKGLGGFQLAYIRAGGDAKSLSYLHSAPPASPRETVSSYGDVFKQILEYIHSTISEIRRAPKPFIAAVDGIAAAGGFGLAMSCDLVIASDRAMFEWAYAKTGLTGAESSTFMLPRLVGLRRAFELLFLNPRITPERALEIGLITAVYPAATFDAEVDAIAKKIADGPTEAMGIAKELINQAAGMDRLDVHLDREIDQLARIADGADFAEGIDAFFAKRQPKFGVS